MLKVKWKGQNFFQIYTFLDSDFSTLIENRNNFQFSQAVCVKSSGKLTLFKTVGNINPAYCPLKISCRDVIRVIQVLLFYGTKIIIPYPFFVCKTVGRVDIAKFTVNKANVRRLSILIKKILLVKIY